MDREMIARHLALAENHVRLGGEHIANQRAIIAELEAKGGSTLATAREMLTTFESMQRAHIADRDRLAQELAQVDG